MKRFYKAVTAIPVCPEPVEGLPSSCLEKEVGKGFDKLSPNGEGFQIFLDARSVRTPARKPLVLPTRSLAEAVAGEWEAQGDKIDPRSMPLTGLANAAIDRVVPDPVFFAADLARYGENDLLCYRAEEPPELVARQEEQWDPLLAWARGRYDIAFETITGIMHRPQPEATVARLADAVAANDAFKLAGLSPLVTISGSLLIALALSEGAVEPDPAFDAAHLDELFQVERWGEDSLATEARDARRRDFRAAVRFLSLL
jgi:chaperone required for assembly of F1-ATPase